jgi:hypothetical protein
MMIVSNAIDWSGPVLTTRKMSWQLCSTETACIVRSKSMSPWALALSNAIRASSVATTLEKSALNDARPSRYLPRMLRPDYDLLLLSRQPFEEKVAQCFTRAICRQGRNVVHVPHAPHSARHVHELASSTALWMAQHRGDGSEQVQLAVRVDVDERLNAADAGLNEAWADSCEASIGEHYVEAIDAMLSVQRSDASLDVIRGSHVDFNDHKSGCGTFWKCLQRFSRPELADCCHDSGIRSVEIGCDEAFSDPLVKQSVSSCRRDGIDAPRLAPVIRIVVFEDILEAKANALLRMMMC